MSITCRQFWKASTCRIKKYLKWALGGHLGTIIRNVGSNLNYSANNFGLLWFGADGTSYSYQSLAVYIENELVLGLSSTHVTFVCTYRYDPYKLRLILCPCAFVQIIMTYYFDGVEILCNLICQWFSDLCPKGAQLQSLIFKIFTEKHIRNKSKKNLWWLHSQLQAREPITCGF